MNNLLSQAHKGILAQLAWANTLLAFDYDGTLAPIVTDRNRAEMRTTTSALLQQLCTRYPCVLISGRSVTDVSTYVEGIPFRHIVGNHGLEPGRHLHEFAALVGELKPDLERALAPLQGVEVEDKRYSLALHYRRSRSKREAKHLILAAIARLNLPTRIVLGKQVINVLPESAPHKGDAVMRLRELERVDVACYVGDDVTDEDVFALDQPGRLFSVRVGQSNASAADYFIRDQPAIDTLLAALLDARKTECSPYV